MPGSLCTSDPDERLIIHKRTLFDTGIGLDVAAKSFVWLGHNQHHRGSSAGAVIGGLPSGAIIGGTLAAPRQSYGSSHAQWCSNRYRTYRASDNTHVPRAGVRAYCNSPYN
ncbi:BA14K family protein [Rhizobium sp.]|uniref:BA14K family protein n=1 Tax=Rhizobium sp. TaxID=391 RepID=UPI0028A64198